MGKISLVRQVPKKGRFLIADKLLEMAFEADGVCGRYTLKGGGTVRRIGGIKNKLRINILI